MKTTTQKSHAPARAPRGARAKPDGFIIVAVLWILGALATLASIYAVYVVDTAAAFGVHDDRLQAEAIVSAGLELTVYQMTATADERPTRGTFNVRLGSANVAVDFRSEAARIDLNSAPKELLAGLFAALGARRDDADVYADRVVGWRTTPPEGQDPEAAAYRSAGRRYAPRGSRFPHASELSLVLGLPPALVDRALPFLTVYSGRPTINVFDAAPQALAALPGMTPDRLYAVLAQRRAVPQNPDLVLSLLGPAQTHATAEGSKAVRVNVRIDFDNGRRMSSEAVIIPYDDGAGEPFGVLSWRDELDELPSAERARAALQ
jgi:general secretion pathway protein K